MSGFTVTPADLQAARGELLAVAAEARVRLGALGGEAHGLLGNGWVSQAAVAFGAGWDEWQLAAGRLIAALGELADAVGLAGQDYRVTDDAVRTDIAGTPA